MLLFDVTSTPRLGAPRRGHGCAFYRVDSVHSQPLAGRKARRVVVLEKAFAVGIGPIVRESPWREPREEL